MLWFVIAIVLLKKKITRIAVNKRFLTQYITKSIYVVTLRLTHLQALLFSRDFEATKIGVCRNVSLLRIIKWKV